MALRARDRADRRLDDHDGVGRVGGAVLLGDHAELHLQTDGQVWVSRDRGRRESAGGTDSARRGPVSVRDERPTVGWQARAVYAANQGPTPARRFVIRISRTPAPAGVAANARSSSGRLS